MTLNPTIAFVETETQVRTLLASNRWQSTVHTWIAVTPEAAWALSLQNISYNKLEDFYTAAMKCEAAQRVLDVENSWINWIDDFLSDRIQIFYKHSFRPALMYYRYLKLLVDQLRWMAFSLQLTYTSLKPATIVAWPQEASLPDSRVSYRDSVLSLMIPNWITQHGLELLTPSLLENNQPKGFRDTSKPKALNDLRQHILTILPVQARTSVLSARRRIQQLMAGGLFSSLFDHAKHRSYVKVAYIRGGYDVDLLHQALYGRQMALIDGSRWGDDPQKFQMNDRDFPSLLDSAWAEAQEHTELWQPFIVDGLNLKQVIQPRLYYWWATVLPQIWQVYLQALEILQKKEPKCVIASICGPKENAFLHAAKQLGIPRIVYQHGGFVGSSEHPLWENADLVNADWEFVYGAGVAKYLNQRRQSYTDDRAQPVVVGSSRLDRVRRQYDPKRVQQIRKKFGIRPEQPLILYIPTMLRGHLSYMCCDDYPDVSYFELQVKVIELFKHFKDFCFVYKAFADTVANPIHQIISASSTNILNIIYPRLTDIMWAADAIIVDFPSTGLLEVLLTDKPLVVYTDQAALRMFPEAKHMLRKRVSLAETPEDFLKQIEQLLRRGSFEKIQDPDTSFLSSYGTYFNDGRSAERAAAVIQTITKRQPLPDFTDGSLFGSSP